MIKLLPDPIKDTIISIGVCEDKFFWRSILVADGSIAWDFIHNSTRFNHFNYCNIDVVQGAA